MKNISVNKILVTKNQHPLVSVIMPVYNGSRYLAPAIESILNQTYQNLELIIVDDRSTDNTWDIISDFRKKFPDRIRAVKTKFQTNAAGNGATNYGLKFSRGQFICRMDADDIAYPKRIEKQVKFMLSNPDVILCGTQAKVINAEGIITGTKNIPVTHDEIYYQYGVLHPIIHPSVMIRRSLLPNPNRIYEMKWDVNDDYFTFFKLLNHGRFANLPQYLIKYRIHGRNLSLVNPKEKFLNSVKIRIQAIRFLNYRISLTALLIMILQTILVMAIPEAVIVPLYLLGRGMRQSAKKTVTKTNCFTPKLPPLAIAKHTI